MSDPQGSLSKGVPARRGTAIEIEDLHRSFGTLRAVDGLSFACEAGQVIGFIGANGAGKTTTMRILATLDQPTSGRVMIAGFDAVNYPREVRRRIGWMPDAFGTYKDVTVWEYLDFYARAYGYEGAERDRRVEEVMAFTDLTPLTDRLMDTLSKGMGQRLCLGRTLLHDPEVLIMDEPAAGLDPKARVEFKRLILLLAKEGKTIFISSHILAELGEMCDSMLFIDRGRLVHHGTSESLMRLDRQGVVMAVKLAGDPAELERWVTLHPGVEWLESSKGACRIALESDEPAFIAATLKQIVADGMPVVEFTRQTRRLEDAFISVLDKVGGLDRRGPDGNGGAT